MPAVLIRGHNLAPLFKIAGEAAAGRLIEALAGKRTQHHKSGARRSAPAFLGRADQHINAAGLHIDPQRARCNAVQDHHAAMSVHGICQRSDVII